MGFSNLSSTAQFYAYVTDVLMLGFSNPIFWVTNPVFVEPRQAKK